MGNHKGRRKGSRNLGYFYRSGRGWYATINGQMIPLRDESGEPIRTKSTPVADLKAAYKRIIPAKQPAVNGVTVREVCSAYLAKVKADGALKTHRDRGATLFDFCTGLPPAFQRNGKEPTPKDRIHPGYGELPVHRLRRLDIDQWLAAHKTWNGGKRSRIQAVKRALNYGVESGLILANPIKGYKVAQQNARATFITPEQEKALCETGNSAISTAIKVCIRTGARPGCEFARLTAKHVQDHGGRMEWVFQADESKTGKERTIRITDPEIIRIVRRQIERHPKGPLFRNTKGDPWTRERLAASFRRVKERLEETQGMEFDADVCMYSCRHTFAKRVLQGYWSGKYINIETLALLMGNSPDICAKHYLKELKAYTEPLWQAV